MLITLTKYLRYLIVYIRFSDGVSVLSIVGHKAYLYHDRLRRHKYYQNKAETFFLNFSTHAFLLSLQCTGTVGGRAVSASMSWKDRDPTMFTTLLNGRGCISRFEMCFSVYGLRVGIFMSECTRVSYSSFVAFRSPCFEEPVYHVQGREFERCVSRQENW